MNCKITENSEGTASNKHTKQQKRNIKNKKTNKKPEIFYEMQNNKDSEGTVSYKHTKQQIFNMES